MKSTGIVRKLDDLGRIVIPKELRKTFGIKDGDPLEIFTDGDRIILRQYKAAESCALCGEADKDHLRIHEKSGKPLCHICIASPLREMK